MRSGLERALAALAGGDLVVYPTETVYGLGADVGSPAALSRLAAVKGASAGRVFSALVADLVMAADLIGGQLPAAALLLAERFWPGPLTLIVPARGSVSPWLVGPSGGVGLRCSSDSSAQELVRGLGRPLTSTSANPSGEPPAATLETAHEYFADRVDCYLDGGPRHASLASTVVEFLDGEAILRRDGAVAADAVSSVVPIERRGS